MLHRRSTRPAPVQPRSERLATIKANGVTTAPNGSGVRDTVLAAAAVGLMGWTGYASYGLVDNGRALDRTRHDAAATRSSLERQIALKDRLITATRGDVDRLAAEAERRHAALAVVLTELRDEPGAAAALAPRTPTATTGSPADRIRSVQAGQAALIARADSFARARAEERRRAFKTVGVRPPRPAPEERDVAGRRCLG